MSFAVPEHNDVERSEVLNEFNLVNKAFMHIIYTNIGLINFITMLEFLHRT